MKVLESIFGTIEYPEVSRLINELEGIYAAITEGIEYDQELSKAINAPKEEETLALISKQADRWDDIIRQNQLTLRYRDTAQGVYLAFERYAQSVPDDEKQEHYSKLEPLSKWFRTMERPRSFAQLLYYHQGIRQIGTLLKMYRKNADGKHKTSRHLFEKGMALLPIKEHDYLERVYGDNELEHVNSSSIYLDREWAPKICWIRERAKAHAARADLYEHLKYAHRAYRNHPKKGKEVLVPYRVHFNQYKGRNIEGRFELDGNMNGYVASRKSDNTIIVGFSGTEPLSLKNWKTNICQLFGKLDPVYLQAAGLVHSVWMGKSHKNGFRGSKMIVCGHSLGGGLMQFALGLNRKDDITGYGYNSAGLSWRNLERVWNGNQEKVLHLYLPIDVVFILPFTYQLGKAVRCPAIIPESITAHLIGTMRRLTGKYRREYVKIGG